jgi:hypothetical protein
MDTNLSRRKLLKLASASLALIPLVIIARPACAKTNAAVRVQLKYQDTPKDGMICATCLEFSPGKTPKDQGTCRVIPGDDEISPNGYCTSWNSM